jgi:hypothetical protein
LNVACSDWKDLPSKINHFGVPIHIKLVVPISFLEMHSMELQSVFEESTSIQASKSENNVIQALVQYQKTFIVGEDDSVL